MTLADVLQHRNRKQKVVKRKQAVAVETKERIYNKYGRRTMQIVCLMLTLFIYDNEDMLRQMRTLYTKSDNLLRTFIIVLLVLN